MPRAAKTLAPPAAKSAARVELEQLAARVSATAEVHAFENHNGHVVIVEATRPNGKVVRVYAEGAQTEASAERVCLAALKAMVQP